VYSGPCRALWSSLWFIAAVGIKSMCVISSPTSALPLRAIIDPAWIEVIAVRESMPTGANPNTKMLRDPDCFDPISPFVGFWICGHAWELV